MDGETDQLPAFYSDRIKQDLGPLHQHLPAGALMHDPNAYLKSLDQQTTITQMHAGRRRPHAAENARETATTST